MTTYMRWLCNLSLLRAGQIGEQSPPQKLDWNWLERNVHPTQLKPKSLKLLFFGPFQFRNKIHTAVINVIKNNACCKLKKRWLMTWRFVQLQHHLQKWRVYKSMRCFVKFITAVCILFLLNQEAILFPHGSESLINKIGMWSPPHACNVGCC